MTLENTLGFDRSTELVEIPVSELGAVSLATGEVYVVRNSVGEVVPSQVTSDGLLLFASGLDAEERANFRISAGTPGVDGVPAEFATKTKGRFAPERYDDFIWENDRVAFRIYGKALVAIDGPSNGIDALYKRVEEPILDKWYADSFENGLSYHDDNGTGLDDYKVGRTLGAGGMAPYIDGELILNSNFLTQTVLDNGPLRTTFRLEYPEIVMPNGEKIAETRTFSIDAGTQMTRVTESYDVKEPMAVAVGYPMHAQKVKYMSAGRVMMVAEPTTPKASGIYLGIVLPSSISGVKEDSGHILAIQNYTPGEHFSYYTGLGWEKFGGWNGEKFAQYLENFAATIKTPIVVEVSVL